MLLDSMDAQWNMLCQTLGDKLRLSYSTLLSPNPIKLSMGVKNRFVKLKKPKLIEIDEDITLYQFDVYETFLKLTPEYFFTKMKDEDVRNRWNSLSDEERQAVTLYNILRGDEGVKNIYLEIFNYFFEERVIFADDLFLFIDKDNDNPIEELTVNDLRGIVQEKNFDNVLEIIQQTCYIYSHEEDEEQFEYKNEIARKMHEKILAEQKRRKEEEARRNAIHMSIPNVISSVSNRHPTINPINVWQLTVFQLYDSFNRQQINEIFDMNKTGTSVWGDEKKQFDKALWYKNTYENS